MYTNVDNDSVTDSSTYMYPPPLLMLCFLCSDIEGLRRQSLEGAGMGFTGKQCIHPTQVAVVQQAFTPSPEKVDWARELIQAFGQHQESGKVPHIGCIYTTDNPQD